MISLGDLAVVILAVGIVLSFVLLARHYILQAQANETAEDQVAPKATATNDRH